ncbi:enoyl-ACP reductase [Burkholderia stagnalis]|uniref:enoyl-ACP reductase n=1 Tax=Burkholderia stagnalis TaxID=1503054 RepID=UPI000F5FA428|nr:enoyl-ACP reductase [Burkholderia stagnalis]RQY14872.1 enoyl-ACP reductase [Burkholderia stagnalis]
MERYLLNALLNAIAESTFGYPIIDSDLPDSTTTEIKLLDLAHALREVFRAGQLVRRTA